MLPYLRRSVDNGALEDADVALVEQVVARIGEFGGEEPPARIHGDLWPGNLLWGADDRVWLVDPAAHGGHRETDLAQLALFGGPPHADRILAAYDESWPLADGWRDRVPLHQLHLLLVHTALFGAAYRDAVRQSARAALSGDRARYGQRVSVAPSTGGVLVDRYGRVARDLRVSLTDKCNLRCTYCMPAEGLPWLAGPQLLTDDEVIRLIRVAVRRLGVAEVRFTGGEPLIRPGLVGIVAAVAALDPRPRLSLTTNGIGLQRLAPALRDAGLDRVNVSLDTLDRERFTRLTRRDRLPDVLAGLAGAAAAGLTPVKINSVLMRGVNDDEAPALLRFALEHGYQLRFIEQMPLDAQHGWDRAAMVTAEEILTGLRTAYELSPDPAERGAAPAETWLVDGGPARVGCDRHGHPPLLRRLRPDPTHRRRPGAQLPVRHRGVGSARRVARRCGRRRAGPALVGGDLGQACRARHRRPDLPATRPTDVGHRRLIVTTVTVRYFAGARAAAGRAEEAVPAGRSLDDLVAELAERHGGRLVPVLAVASYLVDGVTCHDREEPLPAGVTIDVLPPFAGG